MARITKAQAERELRRRGFLGAHKDTSESARVRASREGTLPLSKKELAEFAEIAEPLRTAKKHPAGRVTARATQRSAPEQKTPDRTTPQSAAFLDDPKGFTVRLRSPYTWQSEAIASWRANGEQGVIEAVTGAGKSMLGLIAAADTLRNNEHVGIIVPTVPLQTQWVEATRQAFPGVSIARLGGNAPSASSQDAHVVVAVINSARDGKLRQQRPGLLIADEVHRYGTRHSASALLHAYPRRLGLSATYERPDNGLVDYLEPYFGPVCFHLGYERAIADGVLAPFRVALLPVKLSVSERKTYDDLSSMMANAFGELTEAIGFAEPFARFMKEVELIAESRDHPCRLAARRYTGAISKRRMLLFEAKERRQAFERLAPLVKSSGPTLVFSERVTHADELANILLRSGVEAQSIHSNHTADERAERLHQFGEGRIQAVTAARVLDEGIDVPEADLAIVMATTRTKRQMIQRMGRVIRKKQDGREAQFVLVFAQNTTEDPDHGAHELFLDEVRAAASELNIFPLNWTSKDIVSWFGREMSPPLNRARPDPEHAPPPQPARPNQRDRFVADRLKCDPEEVLDLRMKYPRGRSEGGRTSAVPLPPSLPAKDREKVQAWLKAERLEAVTKGREKRSSSKEGIQPTLRRPKAPPKRRKRSVPDLLGGRRTSQRPKRNTTRSSAVRCTSCGRTISTTGRCGCS